MTVSDQELTEVEEILDVDLDAKEAQLREAAGKDTVVKLRGVVLHVPPTKLWGAKALKVASEGDLLTWAEMVLGEDQVKELTGEGDDYEDLYLYELESLFEAVANKNGMAAGKSTGSGPRSKKRRKR